MNIKKNVVFILTIVIWTYSIHPSSTPRKDSAAKNTNGATWLKDLIKPGVVIDTKLLSFKEDLSNMYNPSIKETDTGYLLIFRHDTENICCHKCVYKQPHIKMVSLDKNFNQVDRIKTILPTWGAPEDARIHSCNGQLLLTYNEDPLAHEHPIMRKRKFEQKKKALLRNGPKRKRVYIDQLEIPPLHSHPRKRHVYVSKFDVEQARIFDSIRVPSARIPLEPVEKNWIPFEYPENNGGLYYIYSTSPYKIIDTGTFNPDGSSRLFPTEPQDIDSIWNKNVWGEIRGGSPAKLVDDMYLNFFHSWNYCPEQNSYYYVMGAYFFQAKPPFKILAITSEPIVFDGIYSAPHRLDHLHQFYPAGFVIEKKDGKTILHVSCGENDTSIRIVSIDKDALLASMVKLT